MSPYPSEHSCRLRSPSDFQEGSFRRIMQGKLDIIIGRLKGKTTMTTQAFRYPKADWSESEARNHCQGKEGTFEAAKKGERSCLIPFANRDEIKEIVKPRIVEFELRGEGSK